jgi:hypothetical protein
MRKALSFGQVNQSWFLVEPGTEQHAAWVLYFKNLGWTPKLILEEKPVTMPTEWPQWFSE